MLEMDARNTPLPPVIGPLNVAAGPFGAGARVEGVDGGAVVDDSGEVECDDEHPASTKSAATATPRMTYVLRPIGRGSRSGRPPSPPRTATLCASLRGDRWS